MATYIVNPTADQEKAVKAFLEALEVSFVQDDEQEGELPAHVLAGIRKGQADIEAGRFIIFDEFKKKYPVE